MLCLKMTEKNKNLFLNLDKYYFEAYQNKAEKTKIWRISSFKLDVYDETLLRTEVVWWIV